MPTTNPTADNTRYPQRALRALAAQMVHTSLHVKGADSQLQRAARYARSAPALAVVNLCTLSESKCTNGNKANRTPTR
jgi:hypothetical protein